VATSAGDRSGEVYGWLTTAGQVGSAIRATVAGPLADHHGGGPAFLVVTAG
jgi:MFS family permease